MPPAGSARPEMIARARARGPGAGRRGVPRRPWEPRRGGEPDPGDAAPWVTALGAGSGRAARRLGSAGDRVRGVAEAGRCVPQDAASVRCLPPPTVPPPPRHPCQGSLPARLQVAERTSEFPGWGLETPRDAYPLCQTNFRVSLTHRVTLRTSDARRGKPEPKSEVARPEAEGRGLWVDVGGGGGRESTCGVQILGWDTLQLTFSQKRDTIRAYSVMAKRESGFPERKTRRNGRFASVAIACWGTPGRLAAEQRT